MTPREELAALRRMKELEAKAQGAVSPPSGPTEPPSVARAVGLGAVQGATAGFGDEINAAVQAAPALPWWLSPIGALQKAGEMSSDVPEAQLRGAEAVDAERERRAPVPPGQRLLSKYRETRDSMRAENKAARDAHPRVYGASNLVSGIPLAFAMPGGGATGALQAAKAGALAGGVTGLGNSDADLTRGDVWGALKDTGIGAGLGAAAGAAASQLPKLVGAVGRKGQELLQRLGISEGRKVLTGGTKSISQAAAVSDDAVKRALEEGAIRPLGTTAGAAERLGVLREAAGKEYADAVRAMEEAGIAGPQKDALVASVLGKARAQAAADVGPAPGYLAATGRKIAALPAEARIAGEAAAVGAAPAREIVQQAGQRTPLPAASELGEVVSRAPQLRAGDMGEVVERALPPLAARDPGVLSGRLGAGGGGVASEVGEVIERPVARFGLRQAENLKRSLQDLALAEYKRVAGNTHLGNAKMQAASIVRQAIEDAVQEQASKAPGAAAAFEPLKKRAGDLISASTAAEKALNATKNKNAISLRDLLVAGAGDSPAQKLALLPLSMAARATGPSTVAAGAYGLGGAMGAAGKTLPPLLAKLTPAERALIQAILGPSSQESTP